MPLPKAAPVTAPLWPGDMFSQPPSKPVATSSIRILVLIISLSR
jgi:hypothetical protein